MKDYYTISEFYLTLKLGIFRSGEVENWGDVSHYNYDNALFSKKNLEEYKNQLFAKKQLAIGLYLLDLYLLEKYTNGQSAYIAVISVCQTVLSNKSKTYVLKFTNTQNVTDVKDVIVNGNLPRKRKSLFRRKSSKPTFDSSPLNAVPRKY